MLQRCNQKVCTTGSILLQVCNQKVCSRGSIVCLFVCVGPRSYKLILQPPERVSLVWDSARPKNNFTDLLLSACRQDRGGKRGNVTFSAVPILTTHIQPAKMTLYARDTFTSANFSRVLLNLGYIY